MLRRLDRSERREPVRLIRKIDSLICQHGKIRLLIDASRFNGWENIAAFENHAGFIKAHQQKVERIAVIAAHDWQHWLIGAVRIFLHPEVRAYDMSHESEAAQGSACRRHYGSESHNSSSNRVQKPPPVGEKGQQWGEQVRVFASEFCGEAWH